MPAPLAAKPKLVQRQTAHKPERNVRTQKYVYRPPLPRQLEMRPRQIAGEEARRLHAEGDRRPSTLVERKLPVRYSAADQRRHENERERALTSAEREHAARRYGGNRSPPPPPRIQRERAIQLAEFEHRVLKLERELRALRADRNEALRHVERRDVGRRFYLKPPPGYRERETRHEGERNAIGQPVSHRHVDRDRQSALD